MHPAAAVVKGGGPGTEGGRPPSRPSCRGARWRRTFPVSVQDATGPRKGLRPPEKELPDGFASFGPLRGRRP